jgi:hypothetical protein
MRGIALALILLLAAGLGYGMLTVTRPVYWKLYAEITHSNDAAAAVELRTKIVAQVLQLEGECAGACAAPVPSCWAPAVACTPPLQGVLTCQTRLVG